MIMWQRVKRLVKLTAVHVFIKSIPCVHTKPKNGACATSACLCVPVSVYVFLVI